MTPELSAHKTQTHESQSAPPFMLRLSHFGADVGRRRFAAMSRPPAATPRPLSAQIGAFRASAPRQSVLSGVLRRANWARSGRFASPGERSFSRRSMSLLHRSARQLALRRSTTGEMPGGVAASNGVAAPGGLMERERAELDFSLHDSPLPAASRLGVAPHAPQRVEPEAVATAWQNAVSAAAPPRFALPPSQQLRRAETRAHSTQPRAGRTIMTAARVESARPRRFFAPRAERSESESHSESSHTFASDSDPLPTQFPRETATPETAERHVARTQKIAGAPRFGVLRRTVAPFPRAARPLLKPAILLAPGRTENQSFLARRRSLALSLPQSKRAVARLESTRTFAPPIQNRDTQRGFVTRQDSAPTVIAPAHIAFPSHVVPAFFAAPSRLLTSRFAVARFAENPSFDSSPTLAKSVANFAANAPRALQRRTRANIRTHEPATREPATGASRAPLPFQSGAQTPPARVATPAFALLQRALPPLMPRHDNAQERESRAPRARSSPTIKAAQPISGVSARAVSRARNLSENPDISDVAASKTAPQSASAHSRPAPERARPLQRFVQRLARATHVDVKSQTAKTGLFAAPQNRFRAVSPTQFEPPQPEAGRVASTFMQRSTRAETASTSALASTKQQDFAGVAANTGAPWPRFAARSQTLARAAFTKVLQTKRVAPRNRASQEGSRHEINPNRALDSTLGGVARALARAFNPQTHGRETFSDSHAGGVAASGGAVQSGRGLEKRAAPMRPVQRWQNATRSQNAPHLWRSIARRAPVTPMSEVRGARMEVRRATSESSRVTTSDRLETAFDQARAGLAPLARLQKAPESAAATRVAALPETPRAAPLRIETLRQTREVARPFLSRAASRNAGNLHAPVTGHAAGEVVDFADNISSIASVRGEPAYVRRALKPHANAILRRKPRLETFDAARRNAPSGVSRNIETNAASESNAASERAPQAQTAPQPAFLLQRRAVASRPELPMNLPPIHTSRAESTTVQRAPGDAPAATSAGETSSVQNATNGASGNAGGATSAGDVELLAHEVWALLKRRLFAEAERMGHT